MTVPQRSGFFLKKKKTNKLCQLCLFSAARPRSSPARTSLSSSVSRKQERLRGPDETLYQEGQSERRPHVAATGVIAASGRRHGGAGGAETRGWHPRSRRELDGIRPQLACWSPRGQERPPVERAKDLPLPTGGGAEDSPSLLLLRSGTCPPLVPKMHKPNPILQKRHFQDTRRV